MLDVHVDITEELQSLGLHGSLTAKIIEQRYCHGTNLAPEEFRFSMQRRETDRRLSLTVHIIERDEVNEKTGHEFVVNAGKKLLGLMTRLSQEEIDGLRQISLERLGPNQSTGRRTP